VGHPKLAETILTLSFSWGGLPFAVLFLAKGGSRFLLIWAAEIPLRWSNLQLFNLQPLTSLRRSPPQNHHSTPKFNHSL
jgi:hypothetical protein